MWRIAGSNIPGVLAAGYFRGGGENEFVYIDHPHGFIHQEDSNVLVIETDEAFPQRRIILTADQAQAEELISWWRAG
jgi:hypothetical protein